MKHLKTLGLVSLIVLFVAGCQSGVEEITTDQPNKVEFKGEIDERFVGSWKTEDDTSSYDIDDQGKFHRESDIRTPGGMMHTEGDGEWLVKDDMLLFKDEQGNVAQFVFKFEGDTLTLDNGGKGRNVTVLVKADGSEESES